MRSEKGSVLSEGQREGDLNFLLFTQEDDTQEDSMAPSLTD